MPIYKVQAPDGSIIKIEGPEGATDEQIAQAAAAGYQGKAAPEKPATFTDQIKEKAASIGGNMLRDYKNVGAGLLRGAGSIGATILTPVDAAARAMGVQNDYIGRTDRRAGMDAGLQSLGADTDSFGYGAGKLAGEIAGTAGTGGLVARGAAAIPGVAKAAPSLIEALRTGGMGAAGRTGMASIPVRAAGGAVAGGASAALVNPEDAGTGAMIGAALPGAVMAGGRAGAYVGGKIAQRAQEQAAAFSRNAPLNDTIRSAIEAGYQIPPAMVNPTFVNKTLNSMSGKIATEQLASTANEQVTARLARQALGMADDAPLTQAALEDLRRTAGKPYQELAGLSPMAAYDLEGLKVARNTAKEQFNFYNRSGNPEALNKARAARAEANALESQLELYAQNANMPELVNSLRDARTQIAKSYTVGRAINDASGTIDARVLGRMSEKGVPLSDGLDVAGQFASAFPKVNQSVQQFGAPDVHNLRAMAATALGVMGGVSSGGPGAIAAAIPYAMPPMARSMMFRDAAQKGLVQNAPRDPATLQLIEMLRNPEAAQMLSRVAPVAAVSQQ